MFGDYDVDGACSSALLARFLAAHGRNARIYIPDRMTEGYGPNREAIEGLVKEGARLIVTVDCGTTSVEPLAAAKPLGADVVVVDHHQADERLPDVAALVNPNRQDDLSGLGHLCAAGVVFMRAGRDHARAAPARLLRPASCAQPDLLALLDLVGLATVCDVVPLKGLNRAYVTKGLQVMRQRRNTGLKALADAAGLGRAADALSSGLRARAAHQCRRAHRRRRAGRAPAGDRRRDGGGAHRRAARQAQPRAQGHRGAHAGGGRGPCRAAWWRRTPTCRCC